MCDNGLSHPHTKIPSQRQGFSSTFCARTAGEFLPVTNEATAVVPNTTDLIVASGDRVLAESLAHYFHAVSDMSVTSIVYDLSRLSNSRHHGRELVLFDVDSTLDELFETVERLKWESSQTGIALLAGRHADIVIEQAVRLKVNAYFSKSRPIDELLEGLRTIAAGKQWYSDEVKSRLEFIPEDGSFRLKTDGKLSSLTPRQLEVLRHLARGLSTKEAAKKLHLSEKAIESHKYRIMNKLDMHDRVELARYAIREGLVLP